MLSPSVIWRSVLTKLLDLSAATTAQGTGGLWQTCLVRWLGAKVKGPVAVAAGTTFLGTNNLRLGRYVTFGFSSRIVSWKGVEIGDDFIASDFLYINDGGHDPSTLVPKNATVKIGNRVWCGANVTICAGVEIGDDVVIGAGSVVIKSIPKGSIAAGVPARVIRKLDRREEAVWSMWPERRTDFTTSYSPVKQAAHRVRARL